MFDDESNLMNPPIGDVHGKEWRRALHLFNAMRPRYSVAPDHVAATAVISALAAVARWCGT